MAMISEKEIRAYQLKNSTYVCPVCATDEEKMSGTKIVAEDVIHDSPDATTCIRCKKKVA